MIIIYYVNDSAILIKLLTLHNTEDHDLLNNYLYCFYLRGSGKQRKLQAFFEKKAPKNL